jgi:hypothetical protein
MDPRFRISPHRLSFSEYALVAILLITAGLVLFTLYGVALMHAASNLIVFP